MCIVWGEQVVLKRKHEFQNQLDLKHRPSMSISSLCVFGLLPESFCAPLGK